MTGPHYHAVAFISDIHANLEALDAVLQDIDRIKVDGIYCLGDLVGYGPDPLECLKKIKQLKLSGKLLRMVCGNHDYAVAEQDLDQFSSAARKAIEWTTEVIKDTEEFALLKELANSPLVQGIGRFQLVHSTLDPEPKEWAYLKIKDAMRNFVERKIVFVGHSHLPAVFSKYSAGKEWNPINLFDNDGFYFYPPRKEEPPIGEGNIQYRLTLPDTFPTMIVNVGSTGQPRDGNRCARYVVYRTVDYTDYIEYRQVSYDIQKTVTKLKDRGLDCDKVLATRLVTGGKASFDKNQPSPEWFPFKDEE